MLQQAALPSHNTAADLRGTQPLFPRGDPEGWRGSVRGQQRRFIENLPSHVFSVNATANTLHNM